MPKRTPRMHESVPGLNQTIEALPRRCAEGQCKRGGQPVLLTPPAARSSVPPACAGIASPAARKARTAACCAINTAPVTAQASKLEAVTQASMRARVNCTVWQSAASGVMEHASLGQASYLLWTFQADQSPQHRTEETNRIWTSV